MSQQPSYLQNLHRLAHNLWWTWHPEAVALFRDLDPRLWRDLNHNPVLMLQRIDPSKITRKAHDMAMESRISEVVRQLDAYCQNQDAWATVQASKLRVWPVAYFSAEFGIHESLPTYAGGLGLLAGDHLKSASDLGVPIVGVGLLYAEGYFRQRLDETGWQEEVFEPIEMDRLPLRPVLTPDSDRPLTVEVPVEGRPVSLRVWEATVGRVSLYLLDSNVESNAEQDRRLTGRLYDADPVTRIRQELILGVGGIRALAALNKMPGALHMNEGHTAFALLEWMRLHMAWEHVGFDRARDHVGRRAIFTTHTPIPAGHDRFDPELAENTLGFLRRELGLTAEEFLRLGRVDPDNPQEPFCMTVLALKVSHRSNGVSALHGRVSRNMWRPVWNMRSEPEIPIGHITNGIHVRGWIAPQMYHLYQRHLGPDWLENLHDLQTRRRIADISDRELWETHQEVKRNLLRFVHRRTEARALRCGQSHAPDHTIRQPLDENALTIGFARRFAPYKRASLIFSDIARLSKMLSDSNRPVQFIFAGKSHPANEEGKKIIQKIVRYSEQDPIGKHIVFVEDYDISVGRHLVQGVDLWLNNPLKPLEACGTSGQKVIMNGGLNLSVLDGWWAEAYDGHNGFAIGYGGYHPDQDEQFRRDADALYEILENQVIPTFFDRDETGTPRNWLKMVKWAIVSLGWRFSADRMVLDYFRKTYLPAAGAMPCDNRENRSLRAEL